MHYITEKRNYAIYLNPKAIVKIIVNGKRPSDIVHFDAQEGVKSFWGSWKKFPSDEGWGTDRHNAAPLNDYLKGADLMFEEGVVYLRPYISIVDSEDNYYQFYFDTDEEALKYADNLVFTNELPLALIFSNL